MRKQDLLRLLALGSVLILTLAVVALRFRPSVPQVAIPTLMSLPTEAPNEVPEVVDLPTTTNTSTTRPTNTITNVPPTAPNTSTATTTSTHTQTPTGTEADTATAIPTLPLAASPLPLPTVPVQLAEPPNEPVENQVIITFAPDTTAAEQTAYIESIGGEITQTIDALNAVVVDVPQTLAAESLPTTDVVAEVEADYYVSAQIDVPPNDSYYSQQWALPAINVPTAWTTLSASTPTVVVAVIDSGVCSDHPDLQGKVLPGWDYVENDATPQDAYGHGCGVAGIIAASVGNGIGMAGIAPNAQILPLRVLDANGIGTYSNVAAAIIAAADQGAQVINLSLGGSAPSSTLENAVNYAVAGGVVIVAAAGNTGLPGVLYPAAYPAVVAVGSVDSNLQPSSFNSTGPEIDTYAPGRSVLSLVKTGAYATMSGTSFAAPHVSGVAALEIARGRSLTLNRGVIAASSEAQATVTPNIAVPTLNPTYLADPLIQKPDIATLSSALDQLRRSYSENAAQAVQESELHGLRVEGNRVQVNFIMLDEASTNAAVQAIPTLGGEVTAHYNVWIDAWVPIVQLEQFAQLPGVALAQPVVPVFPVSNLEQQDDPVIEPQVGSVTSQGVTWSNAGIWHNAGFTGSGINIAIIDVGFEGYTTAQASDNLPSSINIYAPDPFKPLRMNDAHGTAVAEIIHDMAPGASLTFSTPYTSTDMASYIRALAQSGVDIISSSMTFITITQNDGVNDPVSAAINEVYNTYGTLYVQAAGNYANHHWEEVFSSGDGDKNHEFNDTAVPCGYTNSNSALEDCEVNSIGTFAAGSSLLVTLRWNGWPITTQNYDLFLYRFNPTLSQWVLTASSVTNQSTGGGSAPIEWIDTVAVAFTQGVPVEYGIVVKAENAPNGPHVIDLTAYISNAFIENRSASRSLVDPAAPLGAFAVAAASWNGSQFTRPTYSSVGPAHPANNNWWPLPGAGNLQPRIAGYTNVSTSLGTFTGTSAAAPHVAGAAALVVQRFPSYSVQTIRQILENRAIDMNAGGYDYETGVGRLWLGDPNEMPTNTPAPSSTPTNTPTYTRVPPNPNGIGIYYNGSWYLRDALGSGSPNWMPQYGGFGTPIVGDWNGNGTDTLGIYNPANGQWFLRNRNDNGGVDYPIYVYGGFGTPVAGDWDGNGTDTIGIYNPANGFWYLRNSNSSGAPSYAPFIYGGFGVPVVGDWDGDGTDTIGIYDPADGTWYLRNSNSSGVSSYAPFIYGGFGIPVVGDWNGDGIDTIGIYNPADGTWYLRNSNSSGVSSYTPFVYGGFGTPIIGTWNVAGAFSFDGAMTAFSGDWEAISAQLRPTITPSVTATTPASATWTPTGTVTFTATATATITLESATANATETPTITATETTASTYTALPTETSTPTPTVTETSIPPTNTLMPTEIPTSTDAVHPEQPQPGMPEETEAV